MWFIILSLQKLIPIWCKKNWKSDRKINSTCLVIFVYSHDIIDSETWTASFFSEQRNSITKRRPQKDTSRALHFGKHCPRMKANETQRRRRYSHAQNNLIQENRLAYNLAFIESFESERRRGMEKGQDKDKGESEMGARERAQWRTRNSSRCTVRCIFGNKTQQDLVQLTALRRQKRKW